MIAVIYARYSTDQQRSASIEDQVRLCKERIAKEGWSPGSVYTDRAVSGASSLRPGYQKLLEDARAGQFKVVVAEALDRLSRDQEDVAALYKRLMFSDVKLITLAEGQISELHVGLKGTMNAVFLKDLAAKTHRGLRGRVEAGRSAGGISYGYTVVRKIDEHGEPVRGERKIDSTQAKIVRRIFLAFASDRSPRSIAKQLNDEGIVGPSGKPWGASTIHGNWRRGTGILNNELYIGRLVWNRQRFIKDPLTGKRQARPNPKSEWITEELPSLRIIDQELWDSVKTRQGTGREAYNTKSSNPLNATHRPVFLLSGLLHCAACGGGYTITGKDRYGCANRVNRGTCSNNRTVKRQAIEARVFDGLKDKLLAPELVKAFVAEFQAELNRQTRESEVQWSAQTRELADVERRIQSIMRAIEDGVYTPTTKDRLVELEKRRDTLRAVPIAPASPPVRFHPNLPEIYRRKVAQLEATLNEPENRAEAAAALRALIDRIVIRPLEGRGAFGAELYGELGAILALGSKKTNTPGKGSTGVQVSLVAGTGFEPVTFRL